MLLDQLIERVAPSPAANASKNRSCYRCGSTSHLTNKPSCPAAKAKCNSCCKRGHFAKVCQSGQKEVCEILINELTVLYKNDVAQDKIEIVDTGLSVSFLPVNIYQNLFSTCDLTKPTVPLCTYSKKKIPVIGQLHATVTHEGHSAKCSLMVVESGAALG